MASPIIRRFMGNPYTFVIVATVLWGLSGIYIKWLLLPVLYLSCLRTLGPTLITGGIMLKERRAWHKQPYTVWIASALNAIRTICYFVGFSYLPIAHAIVLMYTWPIWVVILEGLFFKVPFERRQFLLMLLAFVGILIVQGIGIGDTAATSIIGGSLLLLAALANALMILLLKKESTNLDAVQTVFYQNIVGALIFLPFIYMGLDFPLWKTGVAILFSVIVGVLGFLLFFSAMRRMPSSRVALLAYFEILTNIFWASLLLQEGISGKTVLGGSLILTAAVLMKHKKHE